MRNRRPVFVVGFARGGTNLVLNLLRSHPDLASPRGETHEVFRGKASEPAAVRRAKRLRYRPIVWLEGRDVFDASDWSPRPPLRAASRFWIDRLLFAEKLRAREPGQNLWKTEGVAYTQRELRRARLLCKNVNGLIRVSGEFSRIFPDAHFIGLVRDGYAVCEGHRRRGIPLLEAARHYEIGCRQLAEDALGIPRFRLFRYEDLVTSPRQALADLCEAAGVDPGLVSRVRLETKPVVGAGGAPEAETGAKRLGWYGLDEFASRFRRDANANQRARLSAAETAEIREACAWSLERFGYR